MNCPVCGEMSRVLDSKRDCESVHRKRQCKECKRIFYTEEYEAKSGFNFSEASCAYRRELKKKRKLRS